MKYAISQMLDEANRILDRKLKEPTWKDEMEWKEDDLLHDYNSAKVMAVKEAKAVEPTPNSKKSMIWSKNIWT